MNIKLIAFILLVGLMFSGCGNEQSLADNFKEYDSTEFITENAGNEFLTDRIPVFSVKYPPEWEYGWVGHSGVIALMISSGDVNSAFFGRDEAGAYLMIIPIPYSGERLTDIFYTTLDSGRPLESSELTKINGQDAAMADYARDEDLIIEAVIARENWALLIVAKTPAGKEMEFRPLLEAAIYTMEIK